MGIEIEWVTPTRNGRTGSKPGAAVRVGFGESSRGAKNSLRQCYVTIYEDLMRELRILSGDRVLIGRASNGSLALRRVSSGGYALCPTGASKDLRLKKLGTPCTSTVKWSGDWVQQRKDFSRADITVMDDGTILIPIGEAQ